MLIIPMRNFQFMNYIPRFVSGVCVCEWRIILFFATTSNCSDNLKMDKICFNFDQGRFDKKMRKKYHHATQIFAILIAMRFQILSFLFEVSLTVIRYSLAAAFILWIIKSKFDLRPGVSKTTANKHASSTHSDSNPKKESHCKKLSPSALESLQTVARNACTSLGENIIVPSKFETKGDNVSAFICTYVTPT